MNGRSQACSFTLAALLLCAAGCGSDNGDGPAPTATSALPATATSTSMSQPTSTPPPGTSTAPLQTSTSTPGATVTPTGGQLDIAICAPTAGPFSSTIDNPFFPLPVGTQWVFIGEEDREVVRLVVTSLDATEVVAGVTTRVVEEREWHDGELVEVSRNFFAQKADGTVCYYGEDVDIYEGGEIVSHEGAWRAGPNAQPGIFMTADPEVGQSFKQEFAPGIAEDEVELVAAGETVETPFGTFTDTIRFTEHNPLDGDTSKKVYARGVGLIIDDTIERFPNSPTACGTVGGQGCAPESARVDLATPSFSNPTSVTNPLFPISQLHSVVILGLVDGEPLRIEVTLLPRTKTIAVNGQDVETLESQFVAFADGRIHEVALDWYGQDDNGAVWYFGEDVFNYDDGILADTSGTWLAGRDGPVAMIMPAHPEVGDVYRTENIPGLVFEEVTVKQVGVTVDGPTGPVTGALVAEELHMEGDLEDKTFAPAYGEFMSGGGDNVEALALAIPTDALTTPPPAELDTLLTGADHIFDLTQAEDWAAASTTLAMMTAAWNTYRAGGVPPRLETQMNDALETLSDAVDAENAEDGGQGAIDVARATLDFRLRHRPPTEIDRARFELWARQVLIDAAAEEPNDIKGDATSLDWTWDRFKHTLDSAAVTQIESLLAALHTAADDEDFAAASNAAAQLLTATP